MRGRATIPVTPALSRKGEGAGPGSRAYPASRQTELRLISASSSARVTGNVHYTVVEMSAGAQLNGRLLHTAAMAALPAPEAKTADKSKKAEATAA